MLQPKAGRLIPKADAALPTLGGSTQSKSIYLSIYPVACTVVERHICNQRPHDMMKPPTSHVTLKENGWHLSLASRVAPHEEGAEVVASQCITTPDSPDARGRTRAGVSNGTYRIEQQLSLTLTWVRDK